MAHGHDHPEVAPGQFHCRTRHCLLKGCERNFRPAYPGTRYCSAECREAAKLWGEQQARERYRRSPKGRQRRREQSRRYRRRVPTPSPQPTEAAPPDCCEGDHLKENQGILCGRPGCYERYLPTRRSPCQKYCSCGCRRAVRRVIARERRWRERVRARFRDRRTVLSGANVKTLPRCPR